MSTGQSNEGKTGKEKGLFMVLAQQCHCNSILSSVLSYLSFLPSWYLLISVFLLALGKT